MTQTQAIETVWFVYSEDGKPLGRLYIEEGAPAPEVGAPMPDGDGWDVRRHRRSPRAGTHLRHAPLPRNHPPACELDLRNSCGNPTPIIVN